MEPLSNRTLLTRRTTSELLSRVGYPITARNLQVLASRKTGPEITYVQRVPLYQIGHIRQWLEQRIGMSCMDAVAAGILKLPPADAVPTDDLHVAVAA